jgi:hypothetical protein
MECFLLQGRNTKDSQLVTMSLKENEQLQQWTMTKTTAMRLLNSWQTKGKQKNIFALIYKGLKQHPDELPGWKGWFIPLLCGLPYALLWASNYFAIRTDMMRTLMMFLLVTLFEQSCMIYAYSLDDPIGH